MDSLRIFIAYIAAEDLFCHHFNIKNVFTESKLKEAIYLQLPFKVDVKKGQALRVLKSLYRLKQAARDWNLLLKKKLVGWGFV